jgi:hypothetical protein
MAITACRTKQRSAAHAGTKLTTSYYRQHSYIECTVDVTSSSAAAYITGKSALSNPF